MTGMMWYMVWPDEHGMVYDMAWRACYMVRLGGHYMVYGMAWRAWHSI